MKKVAVVGASGNMGRRYALILEQHCNIEVVRIELDAYKDPKECDGIIIATPTPNHVEMINFYRRFNKPILCEKPICKHLKTLEAILSIPDLDLSMINQYEFLNLEDLEGDTYYNYYKTGNDSLLWDCINIIGLARGNYKIENNSVIWRCVLNGRSLDQRDIDFAYIKNISEWVCGWRNKDYILGAHKKVMEVLDGKAS
jgi:hypothetical protein